MGDYNVCLKNGQKLRLAEGLSQQVDTGSSMCQDLAL